MTPKDRPDQIGRFVDRSAFPALSRTIDQRILRIKRAPVAVTPRQPAPQRVVQRATPVTPPAILQPGVDEMIISGPIKPKIL